jgi:hypothetical protein
VFGRPKFHFNNKEAKRTHDIFDDPVADPRSACVG